ncbi:hypothetical protein D3C87_1539460 [compost metagenome]
MAPKPSSVTVMRTRGLSFLSDRATAGVPSAATDRRMRVGVCTPGTRASPRPGSRIRGGAWLMTKLTAPSGETRQPMASMAG